MMMTEAQTTRGVAKQVTSGSAGSPVRQLALVRVQSANLSFGCMEGILEGTDVRVTIKLVSHRRQRLLGGWPKVGDLVGCDHLIHSIFEPRVLIVNEELQAWRMLRRWLPYDLTEAYFPIRRPLVRVEGTFT
mmetsp:Transcript_5675/g.15070  ORF Transcript_5675/g.15070 Transcript_5675/m.15070 type:complete len:132 (-) Transcript_5675:795-1190(-)|eukprot:CAMPEP_0115849620 /NCGR_PEP_ID=MMETSP0287-20121206/11544_1 /TAXON_ID=412157 /ORGANISM="Chrysochromulina rotalis, Strain UIO044" /LENGTH=131 /DNA_ID=CAMNT_0003303595 /DNA_START=42 /DNA_END=437 /DNA_ORIENTATION=+